PLWGEGWGEGAIDSRWPGPPHPPAPRARATSPQWGRGGLAAPLCINSIGIVSNRQSRRRRSAHGAAATSGSGVVAEIAAEGVRLLHQRLARHHLEDVPEVLLVLHVLGCLALDDDHRTDELVVFFPEIDLADGRVELLALL